MAGENEESRDRVAAGNYCKKLALCQGVVASNVDILNEMFKYLDGVSLAMASCVCKKWKQVTVDEGLWESICTRHWPSTASLESGQLKSVVVGLGGFRRLYINCVYPLLSRKYKSNHNNSKSASIANVTSSSGKQKWSKDEINLSLSLFSIDRYWRIPPVDPDSARMAGIVRKLCSEKQQVASSSTAFTSDLHRLWEEWRGISVPIHSSKKIGINAEDAKYCWGSMDSQSSPK